VGRPRRKYSTTPGGQDGAKSYKQSFASIENRRTTGQEGPLGFQWPYGFVAHHTRWEIIQELGLYLFHIIDEVEAGMNRS